MTLENWNRNKWSKFDNNSETNKRYVCHQFSDKNLSVFDGGTVICKTNVHPIFIAREIYSRSKMGSLLDVKQKCSWYFVEF